MSRMSERDLELRDGYGHGGGGGEQSAQVRRVLDRLEAVTGSGGKFKARCPAHEDRNPSLSVRQAKDGRALLKCFAGCSFKEILNALGLRAADLRPPKAGGNKKKRLTKQAAEELLEERGITRETREAFGITTDVRRQAWRIPIGDGAKFKRFSPQKDQDKYRWDRKKPAGADLYGGDKLPSDATHLWLLEGELDVCIAWQGGLSAVSFTGGAGYVPEAGVRALVDLGMTAVSICYDADESGRKGAQKAANALIAAGLAVEIRALPDSMPVGSDVMDLYKEVGGDRARFIEAMEGLSTVPLFELGEGGGEITLEDFHAYLVEHKYIHGVTGDLWPVASVNARFGRIEDGGDKIQASLWLDRHRSVEQMTWAPGEPTLIKDRLLIQGGWIPRLGVTGFNRYRPPRVELGDPVGADRWLDLVHRLYPEEAEHIILWLAQRVQRPGEKINHALVLGGGQGAGKDTILEGAIPAIGPWNVQEASPADMLAPFNPFAESVVLRISESRDLGDRDRYRFYDHLKTYIAAPPAVLRVNRKHVQQYQVPNVCGVILTTNHIDGIYLSPDDRRYFVAWTEKTKDDFTEEYWLDQYAWYEEEGFRNIAAYLTQLDLSGFNPKAPPRKTSAFWAMVDVGRAPEDAELSDVIEQLESPEVLTLSMLTARIWEDRGIDAEFGLAEWLEDRKNRRQIRHRMAAVGYVFIPNDAAKDGRWKIEGRRVAVYGRADISPRDRLAAAGRLAHESR